MTASTWPAALASVFLAATGAAQPAPQRLQQLQSELRQARAAGDWQANLIAANRLKAFLNESPSSLLEVARAQLHVQQPEVALREFGQFARMGQSADLPALAPEFAGLPCGAVL